MRNISSRKLNAGLVALAAFSSVLVTSCSSEGIVDAPEKEGVLLQLKASIEGAGSRSVSSDLHDTSFNDGDEIRVILATPPYNAAPKTLDVMTCTISGTQGEVEMPKKVTIGEEDSYTLMGMYPTTSPTFTSSDWGDGYTFTVSENQSSDLNYKMSDYMLSSIHTINHYNYAVTLQFKHALSKLKINLSSNIYDLTDATVTILDVYRTASFTALGTVTQGIMEPTPTGERSSVIVKDTDNSSTTVCAIIPPQVIAPDIPFFKVTLATGEEFTAPVPSPTAMTFYTGYVYTFNITIDRSVINVSSAEISGWTPDAKENGYDIKM